jgi:hypothetical protein
MRQVRTDIEIRQGEKVGLLFTPRLYSFEGESGVTFKADTSSLNDMYALYADILYCSALNLWTLQGGEKDEFPYTRVDFHAFSAQDPKAFGRAVNIAIEALSGKSMKEHLQESRKVAETGEKPVKKKNRSRLTTWLLSLFS